jgi:hypothetical protein
MKITAFLLQRLLPPVWCGMVLAIAFLEAPLKFQAPGITRELGLGIGKLVFSALNGVELALAFVLSVAFFAVASPRMIRFVFGAAALILLIQTFWLIPALMSRADLIISGSTPPASSIHIFYVVFEALKVILLLSLTVLLNWRDASKMQTN